ncbi:MAG: extracellular solute-binding protein [Rhodospirillaceae bacterium]|jgi:multiple sugar transport system substrate-binding protein|nr:extracellular solute-binding protein [Rhodospirillaceae bacterium]MBT5667700.1 extracellular solute-binding protein [Rhodospirillaceae bacterium]
MTKKTNGQVTKILDKPSSRRKFIAQSAAVTGGLAGILATGVAPAVGQTRELKMLVNSHFVPASDEELRRQMEEFGKAEGVKTRLDRVAHLQLPAVLAGEIQGQKGHDIVAVRNADPNLYSKHLVSLDGLYEKIGKAGGGWTNNDVGKGRDGHQKAIPWYFISFPIAIRTDLVSEIGENMPDTWDDVHRIGMKLKKKGHPVGIQLSHGADSNWILRGLLWSYGAKLVDSDSKTVAVNTKETVEAFKFIRALYQDAMESEVLAWDDRNNNVCLASGKCSMILNPVSAYRSAVRDKALIQGTDRQVHQVINHIMPPKGPAGRHMAATHSNVGVWKFSKNVEVAEKFLDFHFQSGNANKLLQASAGYNQPLLTNHALHPLYASNSKYYFAPFIGWYTHAIGWPGVPTAPSQTIYDQYLLPDAAAACATGKASAEDAAAKLESQMKRLYRRFR